MKAWLILLVLVMAGCYQVAPQEEELRTVPTTNNPHALPGISRPNPLSALTG